MKKINNLKAFTLIELLAVIVILAIIALIAVPQVLKILNKARRSATEDSVHGIVESAETYVSNFMLQNNGAYPKEKLEFECSSDGCNLKEDIASNLNEYDLTNLESINFKGKAPNSGNISID